jgi:hypothetical protein
MKDARNKVNRCRPSPSPPTRRSTSGRAARGAPGGTGFRKAGARSRRRDARLAAIGAVAATVNSTLDLRKVLDHALEMALEVTGAEAGAIYLLDAAKNRLVQAAHRGTSPAFTNRMRDFPLAGSLSGRVLKSRAPLVVNAARIPAWLKSRPF